MADSFSDQRIAEFSKRVGQDIKSDRLRITSNEINISKLNETIGIHSKRLDNLTAAAQGKNFNFIQDTDDAYIKKIPSGAMPYSGIKSFGGKTLVWNNIFTINSTNTSVPVGDTDIEFTDNRDGTYTFNLVKGSKTGNRYFNNSASLKEYLQNHKILFMVDKDVSSYLTSYVFLILTYPIDNSAVTVYSRSPRGLIVSFTQQFGYFGMSGTASKTAEFTVRPMVFDLTLMFGAGNEPSTIEEFEALFPADYYDYNAGELLSAGVSEVKSVGRNLCRVNEKTIKGTTSNVGSIGDISGTVIDYNIPIDGYQNLILSGDFETTRNPIMFLYNSPIDTDYIINYHNNMYSHIIRNGNGIQITNAKTGFTTNGYRYCAITTGNETVSGTPADTEISFTVKNVQLEIGDTVTPYVPYKEHKSAIPMQVQNLPGYGWSAGKAKNWVDWENRVYHREVGKAVYKGDSIPVLDNEFTEYIYYRVYIPQLSSGGILLRKGTWGCYFLTNKLIKKGNGFSSSWQCNWTNKASNALSITMPISYKTPEQVKEYFANNPLELYYELATPELIDISDILPADNLIEVEAGGTLTFKNQHGDDYRIPVPSEVEYMINVEEAL